jgi:hypothetical protein
MRITESNSTFDAYWAHLRAQEAGAPTPASGDDELRVDEPRPAETVVPLNVLDADRDGWVDADDIPYDQLMLIEREQAQTRDHAQVQQLLHDQAQKLLRDTAQPQAQQRPPSEPQPQQPAQQQPARGPAPRIDLRA